MPFIRKAAAWLQRRAENVLAALLGIMFAAFMVQIVFRYFFNLPTGWTTELTLITWLWLRALGCRFRREGKRGNPHRSRHLDGRPPHPPRSWRCWRGIAIVVLYLISLPAT